MNNVLSITKTKISYKPDQISNYIFIGAIVFYIITAVYSDGYLQADEHYQIIDFAQYKLGKETADQLPWEFSYKMRSATQPTIAAMFITILAKLGYSNPYLITTILRILSAIFSCVALFIFSKSTSDLIPQKLRHLYIFYTYFLWFLPLISVRFSAECWGGIFFLLALAAIYRQQTLSKRHCAMVGLFLGISVLFRFQMVIMLVPIVMWLFFIKKETFNSIFILLTIFLLVNLAGIFLDRWFYGEWCLTPYNYIYFNLYKNLSSSFGVLPWYEYWTMIFKGSFYPFGIIIVISLLLLIVYDYTNLILWCVAFFILIHSCIPHKELRFLFPVANLSAIIAFSAMRFIKLNNKNISIIFLIAIFLINGGLLLVFSLRPAGNGEVAITKIINENIPKRINVICTPYSNPFNPWQSLHSHFYQFKDMQISKINSIWDTDLQDYIIYNKINVLVIKNSELTGVKTLKHLKELGFVIKASTVIDPISKISEAMGYDFNDNAILIFTYQPKS